MRLISFAILAFFIIGLLKSHIFVVLTIGFWGKLLIMFLVLYALWALFK